MIVRISFSESFPYTGSFSRLAANFPKTNAPYCMCELPWREVLIEENMMNSQLYGVTCTSINGLKSFWTEDGT